MVLKITRVKVRRTSQAYNKTKKGCAGQPFQVFKIQKINYSSLLRLIMPRATKTPNKAAALKAMLTMRSVMIRPSFIADFPSSLKFTGQSLERTKLVAGRPVMFPLLYASGFKCQCSEAFIPNYLTRLSIDLIHIFYYHASGLTHVILNGA
jgi:hypothetical protein